MFCNYCGKEIIDTARFCNFCGSPVQRLAPPPIPTPDPVSVPITKPITAAQPETVDDILSSIIDSASENTAEDNTGAAPGNSDNSDPAPSGFGTEDSDRNIPDTAIPDATPFPEPFAPVNTSRRTSADVGFSAPLSGNSIYPTPNVIPQSGQSVPGTYTASSNAAVSEQKPRRERKYTFGHIMICLAAVAVMAITAGVFAGLYFSVV